ncbi:MAG: hypothetical protein Q8941_19090 [Bacteroidota bacterium]|nr:hypothetical protein [Bacteroidota bacterium]
MKKWLFLLLLLYCCTGSFSQVLKKYPINFSGCSAYFFCDPGAFAVDYSDDSSKVYTGECTNQETSYGIICVKLKDTVANINDAEELLVSYLDYLKKNFKIVSSAGYGKGHRLKDRENTRGIIDYWKDEEKNNWKIKGWTDGKFIGVLYTYSKKDLSETMANVFLDGFRLPGM